MKETGQNVFLCVQDTTGVSYGQRDKTDGLGEYNDSKAKGLLTHSALLLTTSGLPLGLLYQKTWAREPKPKGQRKVSRPYEEKENYRWTEAAEASTAAVPADMKLIHIGDREADYIEFLYLLQEDGQSYVVRSVQNRITEDEGTRLWDKVRAQPAAGEIRVSIPRDTRRGMPARETTLAVRFTSDTVQVPAHLQQKGAGYSPLLCTLIHVTEVTPLADQAPIEWFLVTNVPTTNAEEAAGKVAWYVQRWKIERFHYILKSGCEVEKLQAEHADRLKKHILFYSIIAVQIQHLTYLAIQQPDAPHTEVISEEEWQVLYRIAYKTKTLPEHPATVRDVVLAKLGGFLGRKSDGDPSAKVIWKGLQAFRTVFESYHFLM
ncbi:IS4 family transposase [Paenibacillus macerans]|nr:IS4 family transposase [Paenibacillus macerans]